MRQRYLLGLGLISCMLMGCDEDRDSQISCDLNTFVSSCSEDMTSVISCRKGYMVKIECPSHQCDISTGKCTQSVVPESCTPESYPSTCKDVKTRLYCNGNVKASETCGEGMACLGTACQQADDSKKCTETDYPSTCQDTKTRLYCHDGIKDKETCGDGMQCVGTACQQADNSQKCTETDYPSRCQDEHTRLYCNGGIKASETCQTGYHCVENNCVPEGEIKEKCTDANYPADCVDSTHRSFCHNGYKDVETCMTGTVCNGGVCKCDASFQPKCENPMMHVYCDGGTIKREQCAPGKVCNGSLSSIQCKIPDINDNCDPDTFAETCYSNSARICNKETRKVEEVDCKDYGNGYVCDYAENFYGPGRNVTICHSEDEACSGVGNDQYEYCYEDDETDFRHFYKITYTCAEFRLGYYVYNSGYEECPNNGKCGQTEIRHACDNYME